MVTKPSYCCVFLVVFQTYLVARIIVQQISLNLTHEINTVLKSRFSKFRGNRLIFVQTERQFAKHHSWKICSYREIKTLK